MDKEYWEISECPRCNGTGVYDFTIVTGETLPIRCFHDKVSKDKPITEHPDVQRLIIQYETLSQQKKQDDIRWEQRLTAIDRHRCAVMSENKTLRSACESALAVGEIKFESCALSKQVKRELEQALKGKAGR